MHEISSQSDVKGFVRIGNGRAYRLLDPSSGFRRGEMGGPASDVRFELADVREFVLRIGAPGDAGPSREVGSDTAEFLTVQESEGVSTLFFRSDQPHLEIGLRVGAGPGPQITRRLSVRNEGDKPVVLFDVVLDRFRVGNGTVVSEGGRGWPAFIGREAFAGVEFPESVNAVEDSLVSLEYYPAATLGPGEEFESESAVFRLAADGAEAGVLRYAEELRPNRNKRFSGSYSSRGAHENEGPSERVITEQLEHAADLRSNWRVPIDHFVVELGGCGNGALSATSGGLKRLLDENAFPGGIEPILEKASEAGLKPGLSLDLGCPAEMGREVRDSLIELVRKGVKFVAVNCESGGGAARRTPPAGEYSRYGGARNLSELFAALKETDPEVVIRVSGLARSPWWLKYVDFVTASADDPADIPAPSLRHSQILSADLGRRLFEKDTGTSIGFSDCSFWSGKQGWKNGLIMSVIRTGRLALSGELHLLDESDRLFLQRLVQVRNAYRGSIGSAQRVLGEPAPGEVYGYASIANGRGLVVMFNPSWETKLLNLRAEDLHCDPSVRNICLELFPETAGWAILPGGSFHLHIDPWQVRWFEVGPSDAHSEVLESRFRRTENQPIPVTLVSAPADIESEAIHPLEATSFHTGSAYRCRPALPRAWEAFPLLLDLRELKGELYVNNHPTGVRDDAQFLVLYPWTQEYSRLEFGKQNLMYLATRGSRVRKQPNLKLRPLPYFSSSACRDDWPHAGDCCMVVVLRYLKNGKPFRPSLDPRIAQCAVWLDGVWMEPYRVPPLVPRIRSGFSWSVFMLDLEGDWECVRILAPKLVDCDYEVDFFLTDRLKAAAYTRGD